MTAILEEKCHRPRWIPDEEAYLCRICGKQIVNNGMSGLIPANRRHHCRCCGLVICGTCSPHRRYIPSKGYHSQVRICLNCVDDKACQTADEYLKHPLLAEPDSFTGSSTTQEVLTKLGVDLHNKVFLITGANSGLGLATARAVAEKGAVVYMACRNKQKCLDAIQAVRNYEGPETSRRLRFLQCDLSSLESVKQCAKEFYSMEQRLDVLINNAGVIMPGQITDLGGFDIHFAVNHLAPFYLTNLLERPLSNAINGARVLFVTSESHMFSKFPEDVNELKVMENCYKWPLGHWMAYGQTKTCSILTAYEFNRRYREQGLNITSNAIDPGYVYTNVQGNLSTLERLTTSKPIQMLLLKSPEQGAASYVYASCSPRLRSVGGVCFKNCKLYTVKDYASDPKSAQKLWAMSEKLCGLEE